jgi:hypothetical protein
MTRMSKPVRVAATTLAIAALLAAAGCSSGKKSGGPATATTNTDTMKSLPTSESSAGSTTPAPGGSATAACSLATASDVSANYGEQFGAGQQSSPGGYSNCLFPPPAGAIDSVSFTVAQGSQADVFFSGNLSAYDSSPVSGIGDKAFVSKDGGAVGVEKGSTSFLVHVVGFEKLSPSDLQAKQEAFAKILVSRLP